jgi:hypothetical protein
MQKNHASESGQKAGHTGFAGLALGRADPPEAMRKKTAAPRNNFRPQTFSGWTFKNAQVAG